MNLWPVVGFLAFAGLELLALGIVLGVALCLAVQYAWLIFG